MSLFPYPPGTAGTPPNQDTTTSDLTNSLITYIWSRFVPAFKARGFNKNSVLDVSEQVVSTGYATKVTVAQVMPSQLLSDGNTRVLSDLPPAVTDVVLTQDRYTAFGLTQLVSAFIAGQATLPAMIDAAISGLLNDTQEDIVSTIINNAPNSVGTYGVAATETTFIEAVSTLIQNYMPQERYYGLLAPTAGSYDQFMQLNRVTWAQVRGWNANETGRESPVIDSPATYGTDIDYNGGLWSASQLVPAPTVSNAVYASNVAWHPAAVAVAMRPMPIPTLGVGAVAHNKVDMRTGAAVQFLTQWNYNTQAEELLCKVLYGVSPAQSQWSCLIKAS
jgi:hypothetical protein